jgi:hypothetical protein
MSHKIIARQILDENIDNYELAETKTIIFNNGMIISGSASITEPNISGVQGAGIIQNNQGQSTETS